MTKTTTPPPESLDVPGMPVSTCYGCGQEDTHPKVIDMPADGSDGPRYHLDCAPLGLLERQGITPDHPALAATAAGKRGVEVVHALHEGGLIPTEAMVAAGLIEKEDQA